MTKAKISEYDASAANNTDVNGVNIAEGCAPSGINNAIREVMAALKRFETGSDGDGITVGGNLIVSGSSTLGTVSAANVTASGTLGVTGVATFSSRGNIKALFETVTVTGSAPATATNFDVITQAAQYYTSNATADFTLNVRGDSSNSLNSIMSTGQSATIALLVTNGSTAYSPTTFQVDGSNVTAKWQGGSAPSGGNASSVDSYLLNIVKTADATFTVFASQTKFA